MIFPFNVTSYTILSRSIGFCLECKELTAFKKKWKKTEIEALYHHQHVLSIHGDDGTEFHKDSMLSLFQEDFQCFSTSGVCLCKDNRVPGTERPFGSCA